MHFGLRQTPELIFKWTNKAHVAGSVSRSDRSPRHKIAIMAFYATQLEVFTICKFVLFSFCLRMTLSYSH